MSVSDDKTIKIWDNRTDSSVTTVMGHKSEIYSVDTSYFSENLFITGA